MRAVDIIMKKRGNFALSSDGSRSVATDTRLSAEEIKFMVQGYVAGTIPEYQISAFLMAVYFNGMTFEETSALTECMLNSGEKIELHGGQFESLGLRGPFVDKHSTGGVGDKISLPLAPIVAACGVQIPMMSGRALGHTGGTLDKLESISGYRTGLTSDEFRALIAKNGYAMTGQTEKIVPADRLLYALRDVTGTVESVPLITASILSKKVAEGSDALVFDVKCGSGAFMKSEMAANELAESLVKTAQAMGKKAAAFITDMDSPLGCKIGNFLEIEETLDCLKGKGPSDVMDLTYALASQMLIFGEKASSKEDALNKCHEAVESGAALQRFLDNVESQGGDAQKMLSDYSTRRSPFKTEIFARQDGFVKIDAYKTGLSGVYLGVGRNKTTDEVCAEAGIILHAKTGDAVKKGERLMEIFGKDEECLSPAKKILEEAVSYSDEKIARPPLILKEII